MPDFREQYKEKPYGFRGVTEGRFVRVAKHEEARKNQRTKTFSKNRAITNSGNNSLQRKGNQEPVVGDKVSALLKWKAERERKLKQMQKKKPPFKVGIVHHRIYSPITKDESFLSITNKFKNQSKQESVSKVPVKKISKVTEKRLKAKAESENVKQPVKIKVTKPKAQRNKSFAPADYKFNYSVQMSDKPLFGNLNIGNIDQHIKNFRLPPADLSKRKLDIGGEESSAETISLKLSSDEAMDSSLEHKTEAVANVSQESEKSLCFDSTINKSRRSSSKESNSPEKMKSEEQSTNESVNDKQNRSLNISVNKSKSQEQANVSLTRSRSRLLNTSLQKELNTSKNKTLNSSKNEKSQHAVNKSLNSSTSKLMNSSVDRILQENCNPLLNGSVHIMQTPPNSESALSRRSSSSTDPALFSPYIVSSRGKSNARKEQQIKRGLHRSPGDSIPTKETVMQSLNISVQEEEKTAQYFHFLLDKEIERLQTLCFKWEERRTESSVTEDVRYQISQAIGQTNLLMNKKFVRFRSLVSDCETGKGEMLVTCRDLQGFWDMMYREIKDCDTRFEKLEISRSKGWIEEPVSITKPVVKKRKAVAAKKKVVSSKPSSIRALIMAARQAKLLETRNSSEDSDECVRLEQKTTGRNNSHSNGSPVIKYNTRRSKSIGRNDSKVTPTKKEKTRMSLLQKVQLSETSKKVRSPLTLMKISKMCKTPEVKLEDTIVYTNTEQTPGRSILKKSQDIKDLGSAGKLTHKVNFNDDVIMNEVPVDEEVEAKEDLATALERIENFDFDTSREFVEIAAERKLNFDSDSSDEFPDKLDEFEKGERGKFSPIFSFPEINVQSATPIPDSTILRTKQETQSPRKSLRRQSIAARSIEQSTKTPLKNKESLDNSRLAKERKMKRQNAIDQEIEEEEDEDEDEDEEEETFNESIRILRNRTILSKDVPKTPRSPRTPRTPRRRRSTKVSISMEDTEQKENRTPSRRPKRSALKVSIKEEDNHAAHLEEAIGKITLVENDDKRRRTGRLSVKYTEEDCTGCIEGKPVFPVTPHVRRSRLVQSSEKKRRSTFTDDIHRSETSVKSLEKKRRSRSTKL